MSLDSNNNSKRGLDIDRVKRESKAERVRKERVRREETQEARSWRRLTAREQERFGSDENVASKVELHTNGHQVLVEENLDVGAGKNEGTRPRVLTLAETMHRLGKITSQEWQAIEELRKRVMRLVPHSEGVSSYGLSPGRADPTTKAARKGKALTGIEVDWRTGDAKLDRGSNRSDLRKLADQLYAMAGIETESGRKTFDVELATFLIRSATSNAVTLTEIGAARTLYTGEKQTPAAGAAVLKEAYQRGAVYLGLVKSTESTLSEYATICQRTVC